MDLRHKFNEDVQNYDKMRPTYVKELFEDVLRYAGLDSTKKALEIGIGTGQATRPFLETGCEITAVELGGDLADFSTAKFSSYANLKMVNGDFMNITLEEQSFDLIYSATAFHWIPQEDGFQKVYRLLKRGGSLALFWNRPAPDQQDDLFMAVQKLYDQLTPFKKWTSHNEEKYQEMLDTIKRHGFIEVGCQLYHQIRTFDPESYVALLNTYSDHRALAEEIRKSFEIELIKTIRAHGGQIKIQDTIDLYLARKP